MSELTLKDVLDKHFDSRISNIHTAIPGRIESYNPVLKQATVKPLLRKKFKRELVATSMPVITNVPVIFPCTGSAIITFPIVQGDGCLLIFSERSLEVFLSNPLTLESEPQDPRKFSLADAICIPGLFSFTETGKVGEDPTALEILYDNGFVNIQGNTNFAVLYNELKSKLDALETALNIHTHSGVTSGGSSTGPPTSSFDVDITNAKSGKVKLGG